MDVIILIKTVTHNLYYQFKVGTYVFSTIQVIIKL